MRYYIIILASLIILSCEVDKDEHSYNIPNLKENIKAFVDAKKCYEKSTNIVVVSLEAKNDTLFLDIYDTYPNVKVIKFNYDTVLYGHRIIFTGEKIKGYSKKSSTNQFPSDIIENSISKERPYIEEFNTWLFLYKDGNLIYKDIPCSESK